MFDSLDGSHDSAAAPTLDSAAIDSLLDLLGGDVEALGEVIDAFLEEAPARIAEVRSGGESADAPLAGRAAHTLKSNALTFGASRLGALALQAEAAARDGDLATVRTLVPELDAEWLRMRPLLCELRDRGAR